LNRLGLAFLLAVLLIGGAIPVLAWHPAIEADFECLPDGTYQISGHAGPWEAENLADRTNPSIVVTRDSYDGDEVASGAFELVGGKVAGFDWTDEKKFSPGDVVTYVVSARAPWDSNNEPPRRPGGLHPDQAVTIELPGDCVPEEEAAGNITVKKVTNTETGEVFGFTASWLEDGFTLSHGQMRESGPLEAGEYSVAEPAHSGWTSTAVCDDGSSPAAISLQAGEMVTCTFTNTKNSPPRALSGSSTPTPTGTIGDWVWEDTDGDGYQADFEPGVADVEVNLLNGGGLVIATTDTDLTGKYQFTGLAAGSYEVQFIPPPGYDVSPLRAVDAPIDRNSDAGVAGRTGLISLAAGQIDLTWDAGIVPARPTLVLPQVITASTTTSTTLAATIETLPFTGIADSLIGGMALALLLLGGLVLLSIRRREQDAVIVADDWYSRLNVYTLKY
jgi:hypothetical protein